MFEGVFNHMDDGFWVCLMQKLMERKVWNPTGKTFFVEVRTFWHIFRSFDRMWAFYILGLQVSDVPVGQDRLA
jgi:hypothetical protein